MKPRFTLQTLGISVGLLLSAQTALGAELTRYSLTPLQGLPNSDLGVNFSADTLAMRGQITTSRVGGATLVMPQFVSSFALAPALQFESKATFANWNRSDASKSDAIETKLTARSMLPMLSVIEGAVRRDASGESRRKLRVNVHDTTVPSFLTNPITLKTNATIEQVAGTRQPGTFSTGVEAALVQQFASAKIINQLGFKYISQTGATELQRQTAAFSHSWAQNDILRLGFEYQLMHEAANLQSTIRFTWKGLF